MSSKPRVARLYENLSTEVQEKIKMAYPAGFSQNLISFTNKEGKVVTALPFETDEEQLLIKMSIREAERIIEDDDDYDDLGNLREEKIEEFEDKYGEAEDDDVFNDSYDDEPTDDGGDSDED